MSFPSPTRPCPLRQQVAIAERLVQSVKETVREAIPGGKGDDGEGEEDMCLETHAVVRALAAFARDPATREVLCRVGAVPAVVELMRHGCTEDDAGHAASCLVLLIDAEPALVAQLLAAGAAPLLQACHAPSPAALLFCSRCRQRLLAREESEM